jgi:hypothetical protein
VTCGEKAKKEMVNYTTIKLSAMSALLDKTIDSFTLIIAGGSKASYAASLKIDRDFSMLFAAMHHHNILFFSKEVKRATTAVNLMSTETCFLS